MGRVGIAILEYEVLFESRKMKNRDLLCDAIRCIRSGVYLLEDETERIKQGRIKREEEIVQLAYKKDPAVLEEILGQLNSSPPENTKPSWQWTSKTMNYLSLAQNYRDPRIEQAAKKLIREGLCGIKPLLVLKDYPGEDVPRLALRQLHVVCGSHQRPALHAILMNLKRDSIAFLSKALREERDEKVRVSVAASFMTLNYCSEYWKHLELGEEPRQKIGRFLQARGMKALINALEDPSLDVQEGAARSLVDLCSSFRWNGAFHQLEITSREPCTPLLAWLANSKACPIDVVDFLHATRPKELERLLLSLYEDSKFTRADLAEGLGRLGTQASVPYICRALEDSIRDDELTKARKEMSALGRLGTQGSGMLRHVLRRCLKLPFRVMAGQALAENRKRPCHFDLMETMNQLSEEIGELNGNSREIWKAQSKRIQAIESLARCLVRTYPAIAYCWIISALHETDLKQEHTRLVRIAEYAKVQWVGPDHSVWTQVSTPGRRK
jgi:HEAT repeat protein